MAKKPIAKNDYKRHLISRNFVGFTTTFSEGFIKVFGECRGLLSPEHIERIKYLARKDGEQEARDYIEMELVQGMGE